MLKALFRRKIFWFFLIGIILGVLVLRFYPTILKKTGSGKDQKPYAVKKETIRETQTISGEIDAEEKITLRFSSSGLLSWVGVKLGDSVKKYQTIAAQNPNELQKNLEKYLNTYLSTRWDFEQEKDEYRQPAQDYWGLSWDQRNDIDRTLQKAQFDLNSSVLDVELKNIALKYSVLTSPIDGIVTKVGMPAAGVYATPTQAEFEITNPDTLYFSLLPDQTEVTTLTASMSAELVFDSYPDESVMGYIKDISFSPKTGETNTVYEAKIEFALNDPSHTKYRLGMTGDATFIVLQKTDVLTVPYAYIKTEKDKKYVMKKSGETTEKVYVETGIESDSMIEIIGGLSEGDIIYD